MTDMPSKARNHSTRPRVERPPQQNAARAAADRLRETILASEPGAYLGSQGEIMQRLGIARVTLQQTARLLEQEQLLRVQRGINGGYYAARPEVSSVAAAVTNYLRSAGSGYPRTLAMAGAICGEVLERAAASQDEEGRARLAATKEFLESPQALESRPYLAFAEKAFFDGIYYLADDAFAELMLKVISQLYRVSPAANRSDTRVWHELWRESRLNMLRAVLARDALFARIVARDYFRRIEYLVQTEAAT